jgi:hypothetical protein
MRHWQTMSMALLATAILSACTSVGDMLQPGPVAPPQAAPPPPDSDLRPAAEATAGPSTASAGTTTTNNAVPAATAAATPAPSARSAAAIGKMRLQVAPIVGASVEAAAPLTERLNLKARERGITLVGSTDASATNILKGYFSVLTEGKDTTVIYVWDLYDPSGNRLHRINGQQKAPSANGAQGWAAVSPATMQAVADATIDQLTSWLSGKTG